MLFRITYNLILGLSYPVLKFLGLFLINSVFLFQEEGGFCSFGIPRVNKGDGYGFMWLH